MISSILSTLFDAITPSTQPQLAAQAINVFDDWDAEAKVVTSIEPGKVGQVYFRGSWWQARCLEAVTIEPQEIVIVKAQRGLTLIVEPRA